MVACVRVWLRVWLRVCRVYQRIRLAVIVASLTSEYYETHTKPHPNGAGLGQLGQQQCDSHTHTMRPATTIDGLLAVVALLCVVVFGVRADPNGGAYGGIDVATSIEHDDYCGDIRPQRSLDIQQVVFRIRFGPQERHL